MTGAMTINRNIRAGIPLALFMLASIGCTSAKPPRQPVAPTSWPPAPPTPARAERPEESPTASQIQLDPAVQRLCKVPTAYFSFDSAALDHEATRALNVLAACFITGAAKLESMVITGHADPRGETEYNFALGQQRAGSVAAYLISRGLDQSRIETTSRGELDADGTDDLGWTLDRKVVVSFAAKPTPTAGRR